MSLHFLKGKRVLVTGHTGFKGAWLTMVLNSLGAEVVGFSNGELPGESLYSLVCPQTHSTVWGDICNLELLKETISKFQIQYVFHMAAQTIVRTGVQFPFETFRINAMGGATLLEAVNQCPSVEGLLFVTTDKVYQNGIKKKRFSEEHPLWATSPYAASKCCAELMAETYFNTYWRNRTIGVAVVRAGNVIGGGDFAPYRIVPDCVRAWQKDEPLVLRNPNAVRPYQHVLDALFAYLKILEFACTSESQFAVYNVGPIEGEDCTTRNLVEMFYRSLNVMPSIQFCAPKKELEEDLHLTLSTHKLCTELKHKPLWNLQEAVDETAIWYRVWASGGDMYKCCMEQIKVHLER